MRSNGAASGTGTGGGAPRSGLPPAAHFTGSQYQSRQGAGGTGNSGTGLSQSAAKRQPSYSNRANGVRPAAYQASNNNIGGAEARNSSQNKRMVNGGILPSSNLQKQNLHEIFGKPSGKANGLGKPREMMNFNGISNLDGDQSDEDADDAINTDPYYQLDRALKIIETMKAKLTEKDKSLVTLQRDNTRLRNDNFELKKQVTKLKESRKSDQSNRNGPSNRPSGGNGESQVDKEVDSLRQIQMAMQMNEMEQRARERQMLAMAIHMSGGDQAKEEEDRLLQRALEESKQANAEDPNNPDVDNMTYEQLCEMGDKAGKVSRGFSRMQIESLRAMIWMEGRTTGDECSICFDKFSLGAKVKRLEKCDHEYHAECIDKWFFSERRCPVCNKEPF